jgi:hypothetical protein
MQSFHNGILGMVGFIDCMHVGWRLCPVARQGQVEGTKKRQTLILEACAGYTLWQWHFSLNHPSSLNDNNVWNRSALLEEILDGTFSSDVDVKFDIRYEPLLMAFIQNHQGL